MHPCLNPNCKSHGQPHPNCQCYSGMAEGGKVESFCSEARMHDNGCEYYAEGGGVGQITFTPDSAPSLPDQSSPISFTPDDQEAALQDKYGTPSQQVMAGAEGFLKGVAGPLAPLGETKLLGIKPEDIAHRSEANPVTHGVSEGAGLIGGGEFGQLGALSVGAKGVTRALGIQGAKAAAVRLGVENALYTLGDEVSKVITNNPDSIQTAAMHVGLSGLLGGAGGFAFGKASEVAKALSPKAEAFVSDFIGGLKGGAADAAPEAVETAGIDPFTKKPFSGTAPTASPAPVSEGLAEAAGARAARKLSDYLSDGAAEAVASGTGAVLGHATGVPGAEALGAYIGHNGLKPLVKTLLPSIIKPLLSSEASAVGLRAAFDTINAIAKGESALNSVAKGLFEEGSKTFADYAIPDHDKLEKLEKQVDALSDDPSQLMELGGGMAHYMPGHQTALAATAQNALNYLQSVQPQPIKPGILNAMVEPSQAQMSAYVRTLQIAEQPLAVFSFLKKGTLSPKDVMDLKALYPGLYPNILQKVNNHMIDHLSKGRSVPFRMRKGLSMLMGQPLDMLFSPASVQAAQATYAPAMSQQASQGSSKGGGKAKFTKSVELAQSPAMARTKALQKA